MMLVVVLNARASRTIFFVISSKIVTILFAY